MYDLRGDGYLLVRRDIRGGLEKCLREAQLTGGIARYTSEHDAYDWLVDSLGGLPVVEYAIQEASRFGLHRRPFEDQSEPIDDGLTPENFEDPTSIMELVLPHEDEPDLDQENSYIDDRPYVPYRATFTKDLDTALALCPGYAVYDVTSDGRVLHELTVEEAWGPNARNAFAFLRAIEMLPAEDTLLLAEQGRLLEDLAALEDADLAADFRFALGRLQPGSIPADVLAAFGPSAVNAAAQANGFGGRTSVRYHISSPVPEYESSGADSELLVERMRTAASRTVSVMLVAPFIDEDTYALNTQPMRALMGKLPGDEKFLSSGVSPEIETALGLSFDIASPLEQAERVRLGQLSRFVVMPEGYANVPRDLGRTEVGTKFIHPRLADEFHKVARECDEGLYGVQWMQAAGMLVSATCERIEDPIIAESLKGATIDLRFSASLLLRKDCTVEDLARAGLVTADATRTVEQLVGEDASRPVLGALKPPFVSPTLVAKNPAGATFQLAPWLNELVTFDRQMLERRIEMGVGMAVRYDDPETVLAQIDNYGTGISVHVEQQLSRDSKLYLRPPLLNGVELTPFDQVRLLAGLAAASTEHTSRAMARSYQRPIGAALLARAPGVTVEPELTTAVGVTALRSAAGSASLTNPERLQLMCLDLDERFPGLGTALELPLSRELRIGRPDAGPSFGTF